MRLISFSGLNYYDLYYKQDSINPRTYLTNKYYKGRQEEYGKEEIWYCYYSELGDKNLRGEYPIYEYHIFIDYHGEVSFALRSIIFVK